MDGKWKNQILLQEMLRDNMLRKTQIMCNSLQLEVLAMQIKDENIRKEIEQISRDLKEIY